MLSTVTGAELDEQTFFIALPAFIQPHLPLYAFSAFKKSVIGFWAENCMVERLEVNPA